jgi:cobalt-zinc-cadmium efflux system outer membrane protein
VRVFSWPPVRAFARETGGPPRASRPLLSVSRFVRVPAAPRPRRTSGQLGVVGALALLAAASPLASQVSPVSPGAGDSLALTVNAARRLALAQNPTLLASRQDTAIARGGLQQARLLRFNPDFSAVAPGPGFGGSRNASEFTVMQELEVAGQRGLRIDAARFGLTRATATVANATRLTLADASIAFYRALSAQRRLQVTREVLELTERLLGAVRTQLREGEISILEANLAEIEFGRAQARVLSAQRDATTASLDLARLIGIGPGVSLRLEDPAAAVSAPPDSTRPVAPVVAPVTLPAPDIDSLTALALARRPDLAATVTALRETEALVSLSRREALPNLRFGVLAERNPGENRTRIGPAVGLSLPLFNRSQGLVTQRRAEARQALFLRDAARLQVRTDIATTVRALTAANAEVAVFETSVRQPARANSALLEAAFRAGKIALPTLLLLRNQLLDAELGYWQAWFARQEALTLLDAASGALTPPTDDGASSANPAR